MFFCWQNKENSQISVIVTKMGDSCDFSLFSRKTPRIQNLVTKPKPGGMGKLSLLLSSKMKYTNIPCLHLHFTLSEFDFGVGCHALLSSLPPCQTSLKPVTHGFFQINQKYICRTPQLVGSFEALRFIEAEEKRKNRAEKRQKKRKTRKEKNKFTATVCWL